jgi:hypothetical protein
VLPNASARIGSFFIATPSREAPAPTPVDALDSADANARGDHRAAAGSVLEVIERLEPTIGLEPMTCRLRTAATPNRTRLSRPRTT